MSDSEQSSAKPPAKTASPTGKADAVSLVSVEESWQGPLPPPQMVAAYDGVIANGAERIVSQWEKEADHRRGYENRALIFEAWERLGARALAFFFALAALGIAGYCASIGQTIPASVIGGMTIASVVVAMIYKSRN